MIEIVLATLLSANTPVLSTIEVESIPHVSTGSVHISSPHISEQPHISPSIPAPSTYNIGRTSPPSVDIARYSSRSSFSSPSRSFSSPSRSFSSPSFSSPSRSYSPPSRSYSPPSPAPVSRPTVKLNNYSVARPSTQLSPAQKSSAINNAPKTPSGAINLSNYPSQKPSSAPSVSTPTPTPRVSSPTSAPARVYVPRTTTQAPPVRSSAPYRERPVIIRENNSIIDNPWFWMSMWNNNQRPQTVIQQPAPVIQQAPNGSIVAQPATQQPITQQGSTGNFFLKLMVVVLIVVVLAMGIGLLKLRR